MNAIPDIILAAFLTISFVIGYKKGLLRSVWKIAALIITAAAVMLLKNPAIEFMSGNNMAAGISQAITGKIHLPPGGGVNIAESLHLPEFMQSQVNAGLSGTQNTVNNINDAAANSLTGIVITVVVCVALFIIIRLILSAVYMILNGISKAPVINGANRLAGGLLAAVNMLFVIMLLLALFTLFAPADSGLYDMIEHSYIVKYLYDYNILLQLFMKV